MTDPAHRLDLLLGYVEQDPGNAALLADAAQAALDAGDDATARRLIDRLGQIAPDDFATLSLAAMLAMRERRFADAADGYARLMERDDAPALRFNRAWSLAMVGDKSAADTLLDSATVDAIPAAAMLRLQLMHERGEFDGAADFARTMLSRHGDDSGFAAAVSVLALDIEDIDLARATAKQGGGHPDAIATRGMLALNDAEPEVALAEFNAALAIRDHHPRAWIGRGLARLVRHDGLAAAADIDRGAEQFGDHIGSWLAAGWAWFTAGRIDEARARFDTALAIDDSFAESHGSLAVLDALDGATDAAKRKIVVALRLDRQCFSAALAQTLLLQDDPDKAQAIVTQALNTPLNASGQTIAGFMAAMAPPTLH